MASGLARGAALARRGLEQSEAASDENLTGPDGGKWDGWHGKEDTIRTAVPMARRRAAIVELNPNIAVMEAQRATWRP